MKTVAKVAAIAAIMAPSFAFAGNMAAPADESEPMVMIEETAGSSAGSLGSAGGGAAIALGALALIAVAASDGS